MFPCVVPDCNTISLGYVSSGIKDIVMALEGQEGWAKEILCIAAKCDSWRSSPDHGSSVPLICNGVRAGLIKGHVATTLVQYPHVFQGMYGGGGGLESVRIVEGLRTVEERTAALNGVFGDLRDKGTYPCLRGWRNENYSVGESFSSKTVLFHCERAAAKLLGMKQYGVHINGYVREASGEIKMWIGKRSDNKQTYPGLLDNMVAGGIAAGDSPLETVVKECNEEASIPPAIATMATPVGTISYCHDAVDGVEPETEFMYDLQLPLDFVPTPLDGEVSQYYLWGMDKIKEEIASGHFKPNSALVCLKFMIRHGLITPETEPLYEHLSCSSHINHYQ